MAKKEKDPNRLRFKTYYGTTTMAITDGLATALMTSWFMQYLTDYSGLGSFAAVLGTTLLLFARVFDAVNDPLEGWIMDRAKVGKFGKYKPFIIISIIFSAIGVGGLFFIPDGMASNPVMACIWVIVFYLIYDIAASFFAPILMYRTLTLDHTERGKLMIGPRIVSMLFGMITAALIAIVNAVNGAFNNLHTAFGVTVCVGLVVTAVISLIGVSLVKERYHAPQDATEEKVKITDFFLLLKENDALRIRVLGELFGGFIWTFLFATANYYIKWAYCADLTTGEVDTGLYGTYSLICSSMMMMPLLLGTFIATPLMKRFKSPVHFFRAIMLAQAIPCGVLFLLKLVGILDQVPLLFFACMAVTATAIGAGFVPGETITMECMDYEIYKNGKDRSALCNAALKFLSKAQSAVSTALVGSILVAIGYVVDSATDTYIGDLAAIPNMLYSFILVMGLIPFVLGMISWFIYKRYPITPEMSKDIRARLHSGLTEDAK